MMLSTFFSLPELSTTQVRGIDNTPPAEVMDALKDTARNMDEVRTFLGHPVLVSSGYRSPAVNAAVGGDPHSAHMSGHAADWTCPGYGSPMYCARVLTQSGIKYDKLIYETRGNTKWVHISFAPPMRKLALTKRSAAAPYEAGILT